MSSALLEVLRARGEARHPLIGGHRGAAARAPENTLASFRRAVADGAELVELDVHQTGDGDLAVIHDETTGRVSGVRGVVAAMTMAALRTLPSSSKTASHDRGDRGVPLLGGGDAPDVGALDEHGGGGIPSLDDVLALLAPARGGTMAVNVEIKDGAESAARVAAALDRHGMSGRAIVSSFDPLVVKVFAALRPDVLSGLLLDAPSADYVRDARVLGARVLHLHWPLLDDAVVVAARAHGLGLLAWTVNEQDTMRALAHRGVGALLSDDPGLLRATLDAL